MLSWPRSECGNTLVYPSWIPHTCSWPVHMSSARWVAECVHADVRVYSDNHLHPVECTPRPLCKCVRKSIGVSVCLLSVSGPQYPFCGLRKRKQNSCRHSVPAG